MSALEGYFALTLRAYKLDRQFEREFKFCPDRNWRFDFADPVHKVAVEIDGGAFSGGRHTRGAGFQKDCEKLNAAAARGWRIFRYTKKEGMTQFVRDYQALLAEDQKAEAA